MTEEEKKLIDGFFNKGWCCDLDEIYNIVMKMSALIEKLEKEIEQINNRDIKRLAEIGELRTENSYLKQENEYLNCICESDEDNYINKGKIREKIKELEQQKDLFFEKTVIQGRIDLLKELLEEE